MSVGFKISRKINADADDLFGDTVCISFEHRAVDVNPNPVPFFVLHPVNTGISIPFVFPEILDPLFHDVKVVRVIIVFRPFGSKGFNFTVGVPGEIHKVVVRPDVTEFCKVMDKNSDVQFADNIPEEF